jgi:hypothetical protein
MIYSVYQRNIDTRDGLVVIEIPPTENTYSTVSFKCLKVIGVADYFKKTCGLDRDGLHTNDKQLMNLQASLIKNISHF